jgi:acyl-CoA thioester hydrolase
MGVVWRASDAEGWMQARDLMSPAFACYLRVRSNELDSLGHVNNANYVIFIEQAAIDHAAALGLDQGRLAEIGGVFLTRRHFIDYIKPAFAYDHLRVVTWIGGMHGARATRFYEIERLRAAEVTTWPLPDRQLATGETLPPFGELILRARTDWAFVDVSTGRPRRMPPEVLAVFPGRDSPD